jgi:N-acetylglucosaminylphosphatidylinositol deacetylase
MVGNNYGLGETRKKELGGACNVLGIDRQERCVVLDKKYHSLCLSWWRLTGRELQDNPDLWWDTDVVENVIEEYVKRWKIDSIITFDDGGVSGHINHRAVAAGVRYKTPRSPPLFKRLLDLLTGRHFILANPSTQVAAYQVSSIFVLRKYTMLLDLPILLILSLPRCIKVSFFMLGDKVGTWGLMVSSPSMYFTARRAFEQHASQVVWDR